MAVGPDGKLVIGGTFNLYNGTTRICLARLTDSNLNFTAVSRKVHATGPFDINLPLSGAAGVECRTGGVNNDYQVVFTFAGAVTLSNASVTSGTGSVSSFTGSGTTTLTIGLTGVTSAQRITLTLAGVSSGPSTTNVGVPMGILVGDTNGNGSVTSSDIAQTKAQSGQTVTGSNFRSDVNVSGNTISSSDISLVKSKSGTSLPPAAPQRSFFSR